MRDLKNARSGIALALVAASGLSGCASLTARQQCQIGVSGTGAVLGALGGGLGTAKIANDPVDDGEIAAGAAAGMVVGGLIGYGLSHLICHEEPPPPPPPAPPAPSAPAPPPTERRGG